MAALIINNVQTGTVAFGASDSSKTVTITSVDTSKCFILFEWKTEEASVRSQLFRAVLTDATTITISRNAASGTATTRWWAVEFSAGLTVSHFTGTAKNTNTSIGSTVDLSKTFGILSYNHSGFGVLDGATNMGVDIVSTTNFQVKCNVSTGTTAWGVQIVEFDNDAAPVVEAATITITNTNSSASATIGAVTIADSMVIGGGEYDDASAARSQTLLFDWTLTSTTNLQISRVSTAAQIIGYLFAIDWGSNVDIRNGTGTLTAVEGVSETQTFSALGGTGDAVAFIRGGAPAFGAESPGNVNVQDEHFVETSLDSTTQITVSRIGIATDFGPYVWQVIDFSGFVAAAGATPKGPLGQVFHGPFRGPIG